MENNVNVLYFSANRWRTWGRAFVEGTGQDQTAQNVQSYHPSLNYDHDHLACYIQISVQMQAFKVPGNAIWEIECLTFALEIRLITV